jgi:hypothetical protein
MSVTDYVWNTTPFLWNTIPFTWDEIIIIDDIVQQIENGVGYVEAYDTLKDEDKRKFITIIAKVKGNLELSQSQNYSQTKEVNDKIKVSALDIKIVIESVYKSIGLKVENITF